MRHFILFALAAAMLAGCVSEAPDQGAAPLVPGMQSNITPNVTPNVTIASPNASNATPVSTPPANVSAGTANASAQGNGNAAVNATVPVNGTANASGILFGEGRYALTIDDLTVPDGEACAIMSISYSSNRTTLTRLVLCPGESQNWIDPGGRVFRIRVLKTAAGYSGGAGWAQVDVFG